MPEFGLQKLPGALKKGTRSASARGSRASTLPQGWSFIGRQSLTLDDRLGPFKQDVHRIGQARELGQIQAHHEETRTVSPPRGREGCILEPRPVNLPE